MTTCSTRQLLPSQPSPRYLLHHAARVAVCGLFLLAPALAAASPAPPPKPAPAAAAPTKDARPATKPPGQAAKPAPSPAPVPAPKEFPGPLLRRFLDGPMRDIEEIVFAVRVPGRDHWYVTFGNYADYSDIAKNNSFCFQDDVYWGYGEGARLCRLNLRTGKLRVIFEDPKGGIRDPQIHYDGKKILFAYRKGGTHPFHLHEINIDGSGLRQLTDGPDDDIEPTYCPDGSIVFCSSRCRRFVNCWYTRVAALYRCDAGGGNIRMLSSNNDHDNTPWLLPDGRVLYMRWEYVDRSQVHYHHLWTMNPDGTNQTVYFGNNKPGIAMLDAKPIPGSDKVVSVFSPGHGRPEHLGQIAVVDPKMGPDDPRAVREVTKRSDWKDPVAFSEDCFLAAHPKGLFVIDGQGNEEPVYQLDGADAGRLHCHEPRPLAARPREGVIAPRVELARATGTYLLQDIYHGRGMEGVKRGAIRKLLVLQQLPKPVNFSGGMEPLTIGGSFTLAEILGEVPVEPDGSAYMELPALRSLFFVALDENSRSVKRMHSFTTLQPGEVTGCVGCHENRTNSAIDRPINLLQALKKPPERVKPIAGMPAVPDFPRDIQPILDRHCLSCHSSDRPDGGVNLSGDRTAGYTISYWTMQGHKLVSDGRNQPTGSRPPYTYGSAASRLLDLAAGGHYDTRVSAQEMRLLELWIDTSATYPGTYSALGCGTFPVHVPYGPMMQRCGSCHSGEFKDDKGAPQRRLAVKGRSDRSLEIYQNIDNPAKSLVLRAPLARGAGGLGLCGEPVFKTTDDPLYQSILAALADAHRRLQQEKRFDMPGFRPNQHYIREMQRFGILPANLAPNAPVDPYQTDRAYWDSFHHRPAAPQAASS